MGNLLGAEENQPIPEVIQPALRLYKLVWYKIKNNQVAVKYNAIWD